MEINNPQSVNEVTESIISNDFLDLIVFPTNLYLANAMKNHIKLTGLWNGPIQPIVK